MFRKGSMVLVHSEQGQWHDQKYGDGPLCVKEARRNPLRIKFKLLTIAWKALCGLAAFGLLLLPSFLFTMLQLNWLPFCSLNSLRSLPPQCLSKFNCFLCQDTLPKNAYSCLLLITQALAQISPPWREAFSAYLSITLYYLSIFKMHTSFDPIILLLVSHPTDVFKSEYNQMNKDIHWAFIC